jgi:hypothetical protein
MASRARSAQGPAGPTPPAGLEAPNDRLQRRFFEHAEAVRDARGRLVAIKKTSSRGIQRIGELEGQIALLQAQFATLKKLYDNERRASFNAHRTAQQLAAKLARLQAPIDQARAQQRAWDVQRAARFANLRGGVYHSRG